MAQLVSSWYQNKTLPESYIFPPETRPGDLIVPACKTIPVIDLGKAEGQNRADIVRQILTACEEYRFLQVVNHGIPEEVMKASMDVLKEVFEMTAEDKAMLYSKDPKRSCRLLTGGARYAREKVHHWRDNLRHPCHPLQDCIKHWPEKQIRYSESTILSVNNYPPCPDPSLTLGLSKHCDPGLITIVHQGDENGLQVLNNGEWIGVEFLQNALVVNIGHQLQIISNNKLKCSEHRVVTNSRVARTTAVFFIFPSDDCIVEPAKSLIGNASHYRAFESKEFRHEYFTNNGVSDVVMERFKSQA
ncbi:hypothetical protein V6N13_045218 [Hibiscus sabdariffa]|uniref:Fe2OG dioxygenase domain-containing protein n=1 Tax=Hibiscus sabdariffa TaxID=183260 RepID=A0ABR2RKW9_9ROSI